MRNPRYFKDGLPSLNKNTVSTRKYLNLKKLKGVSLVFYSEHWDKEKIKNLAQNGFLKTRKKKSEFLSF